jgi:hypothetical protein
LDKSREEKNELIKGRKICEMAFPGNTDKSHRGKTWQTCHSGFLMQSGVWDTLSLTKGRTFGTLAPLTYLYASTAKPKFHSLQQSSGVGPKQGNAIFPQCLG